MKLRVLFAIPIVLTAMFSLALVAAASPGSSFKLLAQTAAPDNDRDTLLDEFDLDDDNDGVADFDDPEPFNPAVPAATAPGQSDPAQGAPDNDGDTLLDDYDLDDDNDGKADADDPDPLSPQIPLPQPSTTPVPVTAAPPTAKQGVEQPPVSVPVVTSLPSTGSGMEASSLARDLAIGLVTVATAAISARIRLATKA